MSLVGYRGTSVFLCIFYVQLHWGLFKSFSAFVCGLVYFLLLFHRAALCAGNMNIFWETSEFLKK